MDEEQSVMAWSLTRKAWMKNRGIGLVSDKEGVDEEQSVMAWSLVSVKEDMDEEQSVIAWSLTKKVWMKNRV